MLQDKHIHIMKYLPDIMKLQSFMYCKYNYQIEGKEAVNTTLGDLRRQCPGDEYNQ